MEAGDYGVFIHQPMSYWLPCLVILAIAAVAGTFGNITILYLVFSNKRLRNVESIFIVNLALADLYVTLLADPMSFIAKVKGEAFFELVPGLCQIIASVCTVSCVASLLTIAMMSLNRYLYICHHRLYKKIFTKRNCVYICVSLYAFGGVLVLLNRFGIGDHTFDHKSLECIWDRMATYYYTVAFSIILVWIPSIVIGASYFRMYMFVRKHSNKIQATQSQYRNSTNSVTPTSARRLQLAKTLFVIYAVFVICWAPYAVLIVLDSDDTYPHVIHVYITLIAHLHPSINWLIYYITNKNFTNAYRQMFQACCSRIKRIKRSSIHSQSSGVYSDVHVRARHTTRISVTGSSAMSTTFNNESRPHSGTEHVLQTL